MNAQRVQGSGGSLRIGGREAATLGAWVFTRTGEQPWTVTADVVGRDPYWCDRGGPFDLHLTLVRETARWRRVAVTFPTETHAVITGQGGPE